MSNKTSFKRIALAVVAALGFGALASGPSNATIQAGSTMSVASATATAVAGVDTATAVLTVNFTSTGAVNDSMIVTAVRTSGSTPGVTPAFRAAVAADSTNAVAINVATGAAWVDAVQASAVSATLRFDVVKPTTAGTYTYTFYPSFTGTVASGAVAPAPVTWTLTVTAANTKPAAAQSSAYLIKHPLPAVANMVDSAIAATAGDAGTTAAVGYIVWIQRNSDSATVAAGPTVAESVTAVISGAGLLSVPGGTKQGAVVANNVESITVWSDGRGGTATITLTTTSMTTWATKSVTFFGTAKSATLTAFRGTVSKSGDDSATALRVVLKDANSALVAGTATNMYVHSSDTNVVKNGLCSVNVGVTTGYGNCSLSGLVNDSGTTKIKVANFAYESITTHASLATSYVSAEEVTIKVAGAPAKIKATFDKSTYNPGDEATVTLTLTDGLGNLMDTHTSLSGALASGLDYSAGGDVSDTVITFSGGKKTYTYTMPTSGQKVTLKYTGGAGLSGTQTEDSATVTVVDPAEVAATSALDAAQDAADAAIEAGDAATLAQEAADEAAQAAQDAQATAQAAVDAVTALSGEVTKLVAQLATLQKIINRIAKKVGVKTK